MYLVRPFSAAVPGLGPRDSSHVVETFRAFGLYKNHTATVVLFHWVIAAEGCKTHSLRS